MGSGHADTGAIVGGGRRNFAKAQDSQAGGKVFTHRKESTDFPAHARRRKADAYELRSSISRCLRCIGEGDKLWFTPECYVLINYIKGHLF